MPCPSCLADRNFCHLSLGLSAHLKRALALFVDYEPLFAKYDVPEHHPNFGTRLEF